MKLTKKAEMGVGTLIIFIAMLLVAAVAAGVLIQTAGSLQEKALSTGQQAKGQIATNVRIVEVSATDGSNGSVLYFEEIVKLAPGSDPIKIGQAIFTFNTYDNTATLKYRGVNNTYDNSLTGYLTYRQRVLPAFGLTPVALTNDLDDDGNADYIKTLSSGTQIEFNISNDGTPVLINISTGANISNASGTPVTLALASTTIAKNGVTYGTIAISGNTSTNDTIDADLATLTPEKIGQGYFAVEYLQEGSNFVAGNLQRGDVAKIYYEAPRAVGEDEEVRINFIPKIGTATLTQFVTPEVISTERVYMYP